MNDSHRRGEVLDPDARRVELSARIWDQKIRFEHPELGDLLAEVLDTVAHPDFVKPDPIESRKRFYRHGVGPSRWLMVVVSYEQDPGRIITAYGSRKDPKGWKP